MTHSDLIQRWDKIIAMSDDVFTWSGTLELAYLAELASKYSLGIEVGTYMGRSARVMMDASFFKLHLWCVDPFMVAGTQQVSRYFLKRYIDAGVCELVPKHSREARQQLAHMEGKIDFVFVDDGHAYEDVINDITTWLPMIRSGGILCGHDYDTNPDNEVTKAVKHLLPGHTEPVPRMWAYVKP